jgi:galactokinase
LSSSASLEIAVGRALRDLYSLSLDDIALARAAQRAENEFVGAPVGIMDQMACLLADERAALFLDTRDLTFRRVHVPSAAGLVVIHSGISHRHAGGDYATRRRECDEAAARLRVATLRDLVAFAVRLQTVERGSFHEANHVRSGIDGRKLGMMRRERVFELNGFFGMTASADGNWFRHVESGWVLKKK